VTDLSGVAVQYSLPISLPEWELPEVPVPESPLHDELADRLRSLLGAWLERTGRAGAVRRNLAIRWDSSNPRVGVDPDVCFIDSVPDGFVEGDIDSLRLWLPGHRVPPLAIEIVSRSHPYKDYGRVQEKYAVVGVQELWVYDPSKFGPRALGGPVLLQVWERASSGVLVRRHFSDEPARSNFLGIWLIPRADDHLVLAEDREGRRPWLTHAEQECARAEQERARAEQERARAEQECARAEQERARAEQERARADDLAAEVQRLKERLERVSR
jgi:Uma2 family endonuclease